MIKMKINTETNCLHLKDTPHICLANECWKLQEIEYEDEKYLRYGFYCKEHKYKNYE